SKAGLPPPLGARGVARVAAAVRVPVLAIGGVTVERMAELRETGAHGVAGVSAVSDNSDPEGATRARLNALELWPASSWAAGPWARRTWPWGAAAWWVWPWPGPPPAESCA